MDADTTSEDGDRTPPRETKHGFECLPLPDRSRKPRRRGLTYVRDPTLGSWQLDDALGACAEYVDLVKLVGFYPRLLPRSVVEEKVRICHARGVDVGVGGAVLELGLARGRAVAMRVLEEACALGLDSVEVSRGIVNVPVRQVELVIAAADQLGIKPIAEVGAAYGIRASEPVPVDATALVRQMHRYLDAGAWMVVLESEGITESVEPGRERWDVLSTILAEVPHDRLIVEADDPVVWNRLLAEHGAELNLFVDLSRVLRLEGSRTGLWAQPKDVVWRMGSFVGDAAEEVRP